MPGSKPAAPLKGRQHLTTENVGRQLRAAFDPVPTGRDDFADLLSQIEQAESDVEANAPLAAE